MNGKDFTTENERGIIMSKVSTISKLNLEFSKTGQDLVHVLLIQTGLNEYKEQVLPPTVLLRLTDKYEASYTITEDNPSELESSIHTLLSQKGIKFSLAELQQRCIKIGTFEYKEKYHHVVAIKLDNVEIADIEHFIPSVFDTRIDVFNLHNIYQNDFKSPVLFEAIQLFIELQYYSVTPQGTGFSLATDGSTMIGKRNMVFALIYTDKAKPYIDYDYFKQHKDDNVREKVNLNIPMVLAQMRWDGKLGFVGGNVESHHESLLHALRDELDEEIGWNLTVDELFKIAKPHATYKKGNICISSYKIKVDYQMLKKLQNNSKLAKHYISENCGNVLLQIHENSLDNLLEQQFAGTGSLELKKLILEEKLLEKVYIVKDEIYSF